MSEPITFLGCIAPLQSAVTIASDGGARIKIDVPESEIDKVWALLKWRECSLEITVEPED